MTTGAFWNVDNPLKPWGPFDPDSVLDIPFDWATWLADIGGTYASHTITVASPLENPSSSHSAGIITARIQKLAGQTPVVGQKYPVLCRIVTSNGQKEDQTVYLKIREK
jgi:hypothetical protein